MNFGKYLETLLPSFAKARVLSNIADLREELSEQTIPPIRAIANTIGTRKFQNAWCGEVDDLFKKYCPVKYRGNFWVGLLEVLLRMEKNLSLIESLVQEYYADTILRDAMTAMRINILQYLETMAFVTRYGRRLCHMVVSVELDTVRKEDPSHTQGEMDWLSTRREDFFTALTIVASEKEKLDEIFRKIPEVVINKNNFGQVKTTLGDVKLDPFGFGFISAGSFNPIYHIGLAIAEWQHSRLSAAKAERQALEMKLLVLQQLEKSNSGKGIVDPNLQKRLDYVQGQVDDLNYKIAQWEESYGTA